MRQLLIATILILSLAIPVLAVQPLNTDQSAHFSGSGNCSDCHTGDGVVLTENGIDISPVTHWRSTMMANAARDPLWRAAVSAEIAAHPQLQAVIEDKCTTCHAPMGHAEDEFSGTEPYSIDEMLASDLALDGVSCTLCHQVLPDNFGQSESFTGNYQVGPDREIFGPYPDPLTGPMVSHTNYLPVGVDHMNDSGLCATCHTLFTPYVDDDGAVVGEFPEQAAYLEWEASDFAQAGVHCQDCHMPRSQGAVDISSMPPWHTVSHEPYWQHWFVGGNAFMLGLLGDNADALNLSATPAQFDSTIARTMINLTENTIAMDVSWSDAGDSVDLAVQLVNLTGHKLPTGIPLRRLWVHLTAFDEGGDAIFESGAWNSNGEIVGLDSPYEPHHTLIDQPDQVQIYEGIMADVNGEQTYTLLRAGSFLKDNRLPPQGMTGDYPEYETIATVGSAVTDPDFNHVEGIEGSGADVIHFRLGNAVRVEVEVCYQSLVPAFTTHLAQYDTPEIVEFLTYYGAADNSPVVLASGEFSLDPTATPADPAVTGIALDSPWPNPFNPTTSFGFTMPEAGHARVAVYDLLGREVAVLVDGSYGAGRHDLSWQPQGLSSGMYVLSFEALGQRETRKLVLVK